MHAGENTAGPGRRVRVPLFAALALVLASSLPAAASNHRAPTQQDCITAFGSSPASGTCELQSTSASGDNCTFDGLCQSSNSTSTSTSITVSHDDADDLQNCGGTLALSC